jgi:hypothetical protein
MVGLDSTILGLQQVVENATCDKRVVNGRLFMQAVEVLQELESNP